MITKMRRRRGQKGFTLIELMIVVAIIGILAAIAIPNFISFKRKAIVSSATANLETARSSLSQFAADQDDGCYPTGAGMADYDAMRGSLAQYGLTFPRVETGLKWAAGTYSYTRGAGADCILYTYQITAADNSTVLKALPKGVCCDSTLSGGTVCDDYAKNTADCQADFGL